MSAHSSMKRLREAASEFARGGGPATLQRFLADLAAETDIGGLLDLAERFTPDVEISSAAYRRILALEPQNVRAWAGLGWVQFLDGEDSEARRALAAGKALNPDFVDLLLLEAALAKSPEEKIRLYRRVAEIDPASEVAVANLKALGVIPEEP